MDFSMFENMKFDSECHMPHSSASKADTDFRPVSDGCNISKFPNQTPLAMTYTPMQQWDTVYNEAEALSIGTIFPELNKPLEPEGNCYGQR